ncbi:DUF4817 domain-containing protein [Trichonephila clavipes]|nr:DUF4817 domain-containing protein [Trichonephila clavipes]
MVDFHKRILFSDEAHFWLNGYVNKQNCRIWSEANPQVYVETPLHPEKLTELWFQQDGATCHTARATIDFLKDTFGDRLISRFGPVNWPPRSCDLTPLDYFLWGHVKSLVYADKPQTRDHLEDNIRRVIADIRSQMLEKIIENWTSRLDYIRASRGSRMPEIIFKIIFQRLHRQLRVTRSFCVISHVVSLRSPVSSPSTMQGSVFNAVADRPESSTRATAYHVEAGWSNRRIGRHLGRSDMVVARCWQQWITEGRVYRRGGSGRPRNTNDSEDRAIRRVATSAPTTSLASIQRHLPPSRHPVPSRETIRRRLTEVGLRSRRPLRRLPLTPHHRQCRLDFCRPRAT